MRMQYLIVLFLSWLFGIAGFFADALPYDYSATFDCLENPLKPQYDGGIIVNPEINDGLSGWTTHGHVSIETRISEKGNKFIVAHSRKHPYDSVSQHIYLEKEKFYTFSAWIQVSARRDVPVIVVFKTSEGYKHAGRVLAEAGCWSMLKGGITVDSSGFAEFNFQSNDTSIDIWIDSVSVQPFTKEEWRAHQYRSIEKVRKANVRLQILDAKGKPLPYANISLNQEKVGFPFGAAINQQILTNPAYRDWFIPRFTVTTFENEMKWYSTERTQGNEDYSIADAMLQFTSLHGILVRGHNIFWDDPRYQPSWVYNLSPADLQAATEKRLNSLLSRYAGKVISWDVNNENIHFDFFESKLGAKNTEHFFQRTRQLDPNTTLFINDYNTIEESSDGLSFPTKYLQKLAEIKASLGGHSSIGIGLEGHFSTPNIPYMRSAIDTLASDGLPIWITELDVQGGPNQASYLEEILREAHSHPAIRGIVIWSAWSPQGCYRMCLTDNAFRNLATGNIVDKLLGEWGYRKSSFVTTDANGYINASLFHGDYKIKSPRQVSTLQEESSFSVFQRFRVDDRLPVQHIKIIAQGSS